MAVGCYVPQYKPFSFKGATAICIDADIEGGRRGAEGEFPFSEMTAYADLGRKIRRFKITVAFRENSHLADAKAFFRICESPGPGTLIHPNLGAIQAACKSIRIKDSPQNSQGETLGDMEFVEANRWGAAFGLSNSILAINIAPLVQAVGTSFLANYTSTSAPFFAAREITRTATDTVGIIRREMLLASGIKDADQTYWRVAHDLESISSISINAIDPNVAWLGIAGGFSAIDRFGISSEAKVGAFRAIANEVTRLLKPAISDDGARSYEAVVGSTRILAAAYLSRAVMEMPAKTMQDGFALYDKIVALLETETNVARDTCDNELFLSLREFSASVQAALLNRIYELPPVVEYDFHGGVFSIVAAYDIYGDARKFGVIEQYNPRQLPFAIGPAVVAPRADLGAAIL